MEAVDDVIFDHGMGLIFFGAFALLACFVGWRVNFFKYPEMPREGSRIPIRDVFGAFSVYFSVQLILVPFGLLIALFLSQGSFSLPDNTARLQGWAFLIGSLVAFMALAAYLRLLDRAGRSTILGINHRAALKVGLGSWLIGYPVVMACAHLVSLIITLFVAPTQEEQVAVRFLKTTQENPLLLAASIGVTVLVIPVIEEVLFRGFLQNYLRDKWGRGRAIFATATIFALFHFASSQGLANLPLIVSIFVLAALLGFVYERQRSIVSPIILHVLFNAAGVSMMFIISE